MKSAKKTFGLTPRETQVAAQMRAGNSCKAIAGALAISPRTAEVYIFRVRQKMHAATTIAASIMLQKFSVK